VTISIRNLYFLFCYAWRKLPDAAEVEAGLDSCPDALNLFARLLVSGTQRLMKRGLDRGYVAFELETRSPRGKLLMDAMLKGQTMRRGTAVCSFDEFTVDVLHNQLIKATIVNLVRTSGIEPELKERLTAITRRLQSVSDIRLTLAGFRRVQLSRNTQQYGPLLRLCELVHSGLMPDEKGEGYRFVDILKDEVVMSRVFEDFLRNFFKMEQSEFTVGSEVLHWQGFAHRTEDWDFIPTMLTDITLRSPSRVIVADAKFYQEPLARSWGSQKIRSSHLYQLLTYVRRVASEDDSVEVEGMLIYPSPGLGRSLRYQLEGHSIRIELVDFDAPWPEIHSRLVSLLSLRQFSAVN
jgi:5-methylcytosine-specific restriction enzyme subunit McrC